MLGDIGKNSKRYKTSTFQELRNSQSVAMVQIVDIIEIGRECRPFGCRGNVLDALDTPKRRHFQDSDPPSLG